MPGRTTLPEKAAREAQHHARRRLQGVRDDSLAEHLIKAVRLEVGCISARPATTVVLLDQCWTHAAWNLARVTRGTAKAPPLEREAAVTLSPLLRRDPTRFTLHVCSEAVYLKIVLFQSSAGPSPSRGHSLTLRNALVFGRLSVRTRSL